MPVRRLLARRDAGGTRELADTDYVLPPVAAIAHGATTPNPGTTNAVIWSTTESAFVGWSGTAWLRLTAGSGANVRTATVDFGSTPVMGKRFTITDAAATTGQQVLASQTLEAAAGRASDENEMDALECRGRVAVNGQVDMHITANPGPVTGSYVIAYTLG